jgi:hypothetical protein
VPRRQKPAKEDHRGLALKTISTVFKGLNIPILLGATDESVHELPPNTLFVVLEEQHWLLCLKGAHATLVFDSLGLPIPALALMFHKKLTIHPWNRFGYQAMFSSACGLYVLAIVQEIRHDGLTSNADVDRILGHLCPYRVERPKSMPEFYSLHRTHNKELEENDARITEFVHTMYPGLARFDHNVHNNAHLGSNVMIGSPLYARAGIHAPTVFDRYHRLENVMSTMDIQRPWTSLGQSTLSNLPARVLQFEQPSRPRPPPPEVAALQAAAAPEARAPPEIHRERPNATEAMDIENHETNFNRGPGGIAANHQVIQDEQEPGPSNTVARPPAEVLSSDDDESLWAPAEEEFRAASPPPPPSKDDLVQAGYVSPKHVAQLTNLEVAAKNEGRLGVDQLNQLRVAVVYTKNKILKELRESDPETPPKEFRDLVIRRLHFLLDHLYPTLMKHFFTPDMFKTMK